MVFCIQFVIFFLFDYRFLESTPITCCKSQSNTCSIICCKVIYRSVDIKFSTKMEILGQLIGSYHLPSRRHYNISQLLICTLSILGLLSRVVECRHRDADNAQLGQQQTHHSSQSASSGAVLSSSDDDGKCEFRISTIRFRPLK